MTAPVPTLDTIFLAAIAIDSVQERAAYLARACGGDAALQGRVDKLVRAHFRAGSFLEKPAEPPFGTGASTPAAGETPVPGGRTEIQEVLGARIGPYQLVQEIGAGGMGTVFLAVQHEPVQRQVALKVIKPGLDNRQVIARFEAERQALALMDHPNIAKVLDAGATDSGRPYFVMELVGGVALTKYCDERRLTLKERLELFVPVCSAVQHAHTKGVIHRDLKPSNVLVTLYDGVPVPKVIDFGIAKAAGPKPAAQTLFTQVGQIIGTLEYMSPEQAHLNPLDIDTRSDVYSLGVLLYELLTGTTPLERKRVKEAPFLEVLRLVREEEPPKPSTRLSSTDELPASAANRGLEPKKLSGLLRGELDWIVMKALEKDRNRRYETANGLAHDLQRYLHDEPVLACPPSAAYRLSKFARRNKVALAMATVVAVAVLLAVVGLAISNLQMKGAQAQVEAALRQAETQRQEAERRRQIAETNFQQASLLLHNIPLKHQLESLNLRGPSQKRQQAREAALARYQSFLREPGPDPAERLLAAHVYMQLAELQDSLEQRVEARQSYAQAVVLLRQLVAEFPGEAGFRNSLAECFERLASLQSDPAHPEEAEEAYGQAISLYEALRQEFPDVPWYTRTLGHRWNGLGELQRRGGRFQQGEEALRHALALFQQLFDDYPNEGHKHWLADGHNKLAWVLAIRPDRQPHHTAEALEHATKAVELEPWNHDFWHTLGVAHCRVGHWKEALAAIEKSRQLYLGPPAPPDSFDRFFEAMAYSGLGDRVNARRCYDEAVQWMQEHALEHPDLRRFRAEAAQMLGISSDL